MRISHFWLGMSVLAIFACAVILSGTINHAQGEVFKGDLLDAVRVNDLVGLNEWIRSGKNINLRNSEGQTALHIAAILDRQLCARRLLEEGIDVNVLDKVDKTALDYAIEYEHLELAALIDPSAIKIQEEKAVFPVAATTGLLGGLGKVAMTAAAGVALAGASMAAATAEESADNVGNVDVSPDESERDPNNETPAEEVPSPDVEPANPSVIERQANWGLVAIGSEAAYRNGLTGSHVVVAQLSEAGVSHVFNNAQHEELLGQVINVDTDATTEELTDAQERAVQSAGIMVAKRNGLGMHGVAYDATLLPLDFVGSEQAAYHKSVAQNAAVKVVHHVLQDIPVAHVNDALGVYRSWTNPASATRAIIVTGAGNADGDLSLLAMMPVVEAQLKPLWLSVVSLGTDLHLQPNTPSCGATKEWCVSAAGTQLMTTSHKAEGGYTDPRTHVGSTQLAAAHVAGGAALLMQHHPHLTPEQAVDILKDTAIDLGQEGVDEIFGHGLVDLERAMKPVGQLVAANRLSQMMPLADVMPEPLKVNQLFASAFAAKPMTLDVYDRYARHYALPIPVQVQEQSQLVMQRHLDRWQMPRSETNVFESATSSLAMQYHESAYHVPIEKGSLVNHPFGQWMEEGVGQRLIWSLNDAKAVQMQSIVESHMADQLSLYMGGLVFKTEDITEKTNIKLMLQAGQLHEQEQILGNQMVGVYGSDFDTRTSFYGVSAQLGHVVGRYYHGQSHVRLGREALVSSVRPVIVEEMAIGMKMVDMIRAGDQLSVMLEKPLSVRSGGFAFGSGETEHRVDLRDSNSTTQVTFNYHILGDDEHGVWSDHPAIVANMTYTVAQEWSSFIGVRYQF